MIGSVLSGVVGGMIELIVLAQIVISDLVHALERGRWQGLSRRALNPY